MAETWRIVDERVSVRQEPGKDQRRLIWMVCTIQAALKYDSILRVSTAVEDVERLMSGYPPPPPQSMEDDAGVVQSGSGPHPTALSNHT